MKNTFFILTLLYLLICSANLLDAAGDDWRNDFDRICANTANAGKLSGTELGKLIDDSDKLLKVIEASNEHDKKVYLIRLKKCRNFLEFMRNVSEKSGEK